MQYDNFFIPIIFGNFRCKLLSCNISENRFYIHIHYLGQSVPPIDVSSSDNYEPFTEPFSYELSFDNDDIHANISNSTALNLKRKLYDQSNGVITLLFEVVLSPSKSFEYVSF